VTSASLSGRPRKRSFIIAGHPTSISLEDAFWSALKELAAARDQPVRALIEEIDRARDADHGGLSGAVRVWVLEQYRQRAGDAARLAPSDDQSD